jgi:hypothetical protein
LPPILPDGNIALPGPIKDDLREFLRAIEPELNQQLLKNIGIQGVLVPDVLQTLKAVYGIASS